MGSLIIICFILTEILIVIIWGISFSNKCLKAWKEKNYVNNFESYMSILEYNMQKAFDIVYKDKILVYSIEGYRPNEDQIDSFAKEFTILTLTLMGNSMANELTEMFGSDATLYTNMVEYFNSRFETDEIRQATIKQTVEEANIK